MSIHCKIEITRFKRPGAEYLKSIQYPSGGHPADIRGLSDLAEVVTDHIIKDESGERGKKYSVIEIIRNF